MSTSPLPPALLCAASLLVFLAVGVFAEEIPVELVDAPRIYKSENVTATATPLGDGAGVRLDYMFPEISDSLYFRFVCPVFDGDVKKIKITAKGTDIGIFFSMRDSAAAAHTYAFGPLTPEEQTFEIEPGVTARQSKTDLVQYPIKFIDVLLKSKSSGSEGSIEISKIALETSQ